MDKIFLLPSDNDDLYPNVEIYFANNISINTLNEIISNTFFL